MRQIDLSPLLKVTARLLDLHDSRRTPGESAQYPSEERPGLGDGRYLALAQEVLDVLQDHGTRSGDEYASLAYVQQAVRTRFEGTADVDVEYVLNVLARPTELKLLLFEEDVPPHVIGDKDTNLVEKAAHIVEFRLSRLGKTALAIASDHHDIAYIEGDVTKLIRAIELGRLTTALSFVERLLHQLRSEHLLLVAAVERASGGFGSGAQKLADLEQRRQIMGRAVTLVEEANAKLDELVRRGIPQDADVPVGLVRSKINELVAGVVRYGRELAQLAELSMRSTASSVPPPSFGGLARKWVSTPISAQQLDAVLSTLAPVLTVGILPMGSDFVGSVKPKSDETVTLQQIDINSFEPTPEDPFLVWLGQHRSALEAHLRTGDLSLLSGLRSSLGAEDGTAAFNCLLTALASPDEWTEVRIDGVFDRDLRRLQLPDFDLLVSGLTLRMASDTTGRIDDPIRDRADQRIPDQAPQD